ncbi:hypothetical protein AAC978_03050 [Desulfitobacterium sp. THU1]
MWKVVLDRDYSELLTINETVKFGFKLSANPGLPAGYVLCQRIILDQ